MQNLIVKWVSSRRKPDKFHDFVQRMANRLVVGEFRYGPANAEQKYMTRLTKELAAYKKTGNYEQLLNIANYALLESEAAENKKFHFDNTVGSVTRI